MGAIYFGGDVHLSLGAGFKYFCITLEPRRRCSILILIHIIHISYLCQMGGSTTQLAYPSPPPKKQSNMEPEYHTKWCWTTSSKQFSWMHHSTLRPAAEPEVRWSDGMLGVRGGEVWTSIRTPEEKICWWWWVLIDSTKCKQIQTCTCFNQPFLWTTNRQGPGVILQVKTDVFFSPFFHNPQGTLWLWNTWNSPKRKALQLVTIVKRI